MGKWGLCTQLNYVNPKPTYLTLLVFCMLVKDKVRAYVNCNLVVTIKVYSLNAYALAQFTYCAHFCASITLFPSPMGSDPIYFTYCAHILHVQHSLMPIYKGPLLNNYREKLFICFLFLFSQQSQHNSAVYPHKKEKRKKEKVTT